MARRVPVTWVLLGHEFEGVRTARRVIVHEPDGPLNNSFCAFEAENRVTVVLPDSVIYIDEHTQAGIIFPYAKGPGFRLRRFFRHAASTREYPVRHPKRKRSEST